MQRHLSAVHSKWTDEIFQCVKEFCLPARACRCANAKIPGMPTALRSGPYRFYFYSHEPSEPAHIHIDRDDLSAKFWLDPQCNWPETLGFAPMNSALYNL